MTKNRFIELLNLYLDEEISESEEEELWSLIETNEEFHRTFVEYSMISQACSLLPREFPVKQSRLGVSQMVYAFGGMAAALAVVFIGVRNFIPSEDTQAHVASTEFSVNENERFNVDLPDRGGSSFNLETVTVSLGQEGFLSDVDDEGAMASGFQSIGESQRSWMKGILDRPLSGSSMDHELQLSLRYEEDGFVLFRDRIIRGVDSAGVSHLGISGESTDPQFSFESLIPSNALEGRR